MIRLFVIYLSYLNIDNLLQIKFVKKFAELNILQIALSLQNISIKHI